jgi:hypothetical protein
VPAVALVAAKHQIPTVNEINEVPVSQLLCTGSEMILIVLSIESYGLTPWVAWILTLKLPPY